MASSPIHVTAVLQRKDPRLPVFVVVPHGAVAGWQLAGTTIVDATVNGHDAGRRGLKRWDASPGANWFIELTAPFCKRADIAVGDALTLTLAPADASPPAELAALLGVNAALRAAWDGLPESDRRDCLEHVRAGKAEATRARRAAALVAQLKAASRD